MTSLCSIAVALGFSSLNVILYSQVIHYAPGSDILLGPMMSLILTLKQEYFGTMKRVQYHLLE